MTFTNVLAELIVHDLEGALPWYETFFGRPADRRPMPGLAEWQLTDGGGVQVFQSDDGAGTTMVTLTTDDLDGVVADVRARGVDVADPTTGTGARFTHTSDPDGNTVNLAEALSD